MRYETFKFIIANKEKFPCPRKYNAASGSSTDNSTDPGADKVNINAYLANDIGKPGGVIQVLLIVLLILMIIYFFKKDFLTAMATIDIA